MTQSKTRPALLSLAATFTLVVLVALTAVGLQGCSQTEETTRSEDTREGQASFESQLPGCWKLQLTADSSQVDSVRSWLPEGSLPGVIELDTARAQTSSQGRAYRARSHDGFLRRSFTIWRRTENDSVRVQREGALEGTMLQLGPTGGRLVGSVISFTDAGGLEEGRSLAAGTLRRRAPVEATPTTCPDE